MGIESERVARGSKFEDRIYGKLQRNCVVAIKTSRLGWDFVCITPDKVRLIEAKSHGYINNEERENMMKDIEQLPDFVQVEVCYRPSPKTMTCMTLKNVGERDYDKVRERLESFKTQQGYSIHEPEKAFRYVFEDG